jgi:hypothetical protein
MGDNYDIQLKIAAAGAKQKPLMRQKWKSMAGLGGGTMIKGHRFEFEKSIDDDGKQKPTWPDNVNFTIPAWKAWHLVLEILRQLQEGEDIIRFSGCGRLSHDDEGENSLKKANELIAELTDILLVCIADGDKPISFYEERYRPIVQEELRKRSEKHET